MPSKKTPAYRALTGMDYVSTSGNEKRVEAGEKIEDMDPKVVKQEMAAGNLEDWEPRKTENVGYREGDVEVDSITARRSGGELKMKGGE